MDSSPSTLKETEQVAQPLSQVRHILAMPVAPARRSTGEATKATRLTQVYRRYIGAG
jgi:hypothetical protein